MALEIKKITRDGVEFLPSIEDTSLWVLYNPESNCHIDKVTLPASYHESRREISETLAACGL